MSELIRFGVSIEDHLLHQFDRLITEKSYNNRSEAIRDLIRDHLVQQQWEDSQTESVGTITIIFDHHVRELTESLTSAQHKFEQEIIAATHVHLDHDHCLEVIIVKGKTEVGAKDDGKLIIIVNLKDFAEPNGNGKIKGKTPNSIPCSIVTVIPKI